MSVQQSPTHIIVEPNHTGHRFFYVALLLRAAHAAGERTLLLTTTDAVRSTEYAVHLADLLSPNDRSLVETGDRGTGFDALRVRRLVLQRLSSLCRDFPSAHIVIPELVHFLIPWALRRDRSLLARRSSALLMRPAPKSRTAIRLLFRRKYSIRQASVAIVRGFALERLQADGLTVFDLLSAFGEDMERGTRGDAGLLESIEVRGHLRDPSAAAVTGLARSRSAARAALGLPSHEALVVVAGGIRRRKGFDEILAAFERLRTRSDCPMLVVAGVVGPEILEDSRLHALQSIGRLWMRNEYVTTSDFAALLCSADALIVIRERDEGLSGVLAQAAGCGRIVVTVGPSAIADTVERHRLGVVANASAEGLACGIMQALRDREELEAAVKPAQATQRDIEVRFARALFGEVSRIG